jgi:hypothetical protein
MMAVGGDCLSDCEGMRVLKVYLLVCDERLVAVRELVDCRKTNDGIWKEVYVNGKAFRWTDVARAPTALNQSFLHILELS